ncbi:MAG: tetratricopeptide repeat protein, partial [Phycisphaerae bacterium]
MGSIRRAARVNVKAVVALLLILAVAGGGAAIAHYVRKRVMARDALAAGKAALQGKEWEAATKHLKRYLYQYPDDIEMLEQYGKAHLSVRPIQARNIAAAKGAFRRLLRHRPGDKAVCRELSKLYFSTHDYSEAAHVCRERMRTDPTDVDAMLCIGRAMAALQKPDEAEEMLTRAVGADPQRVRAYILLSTLALRGGGVADVEAAEAWLDRAVEANPSSAEARVRLARFRRHVSGRESGARADLEAAEALHSDNPRVILMIAEEWMELGVYDRARAALASMEGVSDETLARLEIDPDNLAFARYAVLAKLTLLDPSDLGDGGLADRALADLTERNKERFSATAVELYLAAGRTSDAQRQLEVYRAAVGDRIGDAEVAKRLSLLSARVAGASNDRYRAIGLLLEHGTKHRLGAEGLRLLADDLLATGQSGRAAEVLSAYVEVAPRDAAAWLQLARLARHRDWQRVATCANSAFRLRPTLSARLMILESRLMLSAGRAEEAAVVAEVGKELSTLREQHPKVTAVRVLLAAVLSAQGRDEQSRVELEQAVAEGEPSLTAELTLVDAYARGQLMDKAIEVCRGLVDRYPHEAAPRLRLARLYSSTEKSTEARKTYEQALRDLTGREAARATRAFGQFLLEQQERPAAIALLRSLAEARPKDVDIRMALLSMPEVHGEAAQARRLIDEIRSIEGEGGVRWKLQEALFLLGQDRWRGHESEVVALLDACIRSDRGWEAPVVALAHWHEIRGQLGEAEKTYRRALAHQPSALGVADRLVELLKRQGRYVEAQEVLDTVPQSTPALSVHRIDLAIGRGEYDRALQGLELFVAAHPDDVAARIRLARIVYVVKRDRPYAMRLLKEAGAKAPDSVDVLFALASILRAEGETQEAIALLDGAVERRDDFAAYWLRASFLTSIEAFDRAEQDYIHLSTMDESTSSGFALLGDFYRKRGKIKKALAVWEDGLDRFPDDARIRRAMTKTLLIAGDPALRARGKEMLTALQHELSDDADLLRVEAGLLFEQRTAEAQAKAIAKLEQVVTLDPTAVTAHQMLIRAVAGDGDAERARSLVARALDANPSSVDLKLSRIGVEMQLGNAGVARGHAEALYEAHGHDYRVCNRLADMFRRTGDFDTAARYNQAALRIAPQDAFANVTFAAILVGRGEEGRALQHLESFSETEAGRQSVPVLLALASRHTAQANYSAADGVLRQAAELSTNDPR